MLFTSATFLGIDPTAGKRPFVYAALDSDLRLLALSEGDFEAAASFAGGQRTAFVAINGPRQPNRGLMRSPQFRETLSPRPRPGRWENYRVAEYLLYQRGISIPSTPAEEAAAPRWKQSSMRFFHTLERQGYALYPAEGAGRQLLETYPHAIYTALLGRAPFPKHTLEGRIQRQLALYERRLEVPDPMRIFEEITRHKLLQGILPLEGLHTAAELDALAAAFLAWTAAHRPDEILLLGDPSEGQIATLHA